MMAEKKSLLLVVLLVAIWARCDCIEISSEAVDVHLRSPAFSQSRSYKQPEQKNTTRSYIVQQWSAHLAVGSEVPEYTTSTTEQLTEILDGEERVVFFTQIVRNKLSDGSVLEGKNYILIVKGSEWGGSDSDDRPILLGAHYDSVENTAGTDDNGSGMAALLEVSKAIVQNGPAKYSAIFVAFDFEETGLVGSERFMNGILVPRILDQYTISYPDFQGAIILDTIMNYDDTPNSQTIPEEDKLSFIVGEAIQGIKNNDYRGTFVIGVGRNDEEALLTNLENSWTSSAPGDFVRLQIPKELFELYGEYLNVLLRSDHANFWMEKSIPNGLKAVFITDTADFRGSMTNCYHAACDNVDSITDTKLQFLAQTSTSLATAISRAIENGEGPTDDVTTTSPPPATTQKKKNPTNAATTTTPATTTAAVITIALLLLA